MVDFLCVMVCCVILVITKLLLLLLLLLFCSHIYQPVVDSLLYVANKLKDCEARRELMLKSLQLFVQQGIAAKKASDKADATHKVKDRQTYMLPCLFFCCCCFFFVVFLVVHFI